MRLIRAKDYQDMSRKAANIISAQVILKPESSSGACHWFYPYRHLSPVN